MAEGKAAELHPKRRKTLTKGLSTLTGGAAGYGLMWLMHWLLAADPSPDAPESNTFFTLALQESLPQVSFPLCLVLGSALTGALIAAINGGAPLRKFRDGVLFSPGLWLSVLLLPKWVFDPPQDEYGPIAFVAGPLLLIALSWAGMIVGMRIGRFLRGLATVPAEPAGAEPAA